MKKKIVLPITIILCLVVIVYVIKRYKESQVQKQTRFVMDTYCTIQIPGNKGVIPFIEESFQRIEEIDKKFNILNPEGALFDFNQKNVMVIDKEICGLVNIALQISKDSDGSFDITVYPLLKLWGFYSGNYTVPEKKKIDELLSIIGYKNLVIRRDSLYTIKKNVAVDLGGIAKGYALQEAVKEIKKAGVSSALVDLGGDLYALGTHDGKPWKVGIRNPRGEGVIGILEVSDICVVTSGDYERFFEKDGIKYHHIINPKTGYPARDMASVTVICKDAVKADAWSTALFVMEPDRALSYAEETPYMEALIITSKGKVLISSGLKDNVKMNNVETRDDT